MKKIQRVFEKFSKYCRKILPGDFNAEVSREDIFKPTIGNESLRLSFGAALYKRLVHS
jgi:hypothetical protein